MLNIQQHIQAKISLPPKPNTDSIKAAVGIAEDRFCIVGESKKFTLKCLNHEQIHLYCA